MIAVVLFYFDGKRIILGFYRLKLIEAYGTGIQKIMGSYRESIKKPQIESSDNALRVVLPNKNVVLHRILLSDSEKTIMGLLESQEAIVRKDVEELLSIAQTMARKRSPHL